jgi:hypothetical protein
MPLLYTYPIPAKNLKKKKNSSDKMPTHVTCFYTQQFLKVEIFDARHLRNLFQFSVLWFPVNPLNHHITFAVRDTMHFSTNAFQNTDDILTHTHLLQ